MRTSVIVPEPVPEDGLIVPHGSELGPAHEYSVPAFHVTPGAAVTLIVPDRLPPAHPPSVPRVIDGVTQSTAPFVNVAETD